MSVNSALDSEGQAHWFFKYLFCRTSNTVIPFLSLSYYITLLHHQRQAHITAKPQGTNVHEELIQSAQRCMFSVLHEAAHTTTDACAQWVKEIHTNSFTSAQKDGTVCRILTQGLQHWWNSFTYACHNNSALLSEIYFYCDFLFSVMLKCRFVRFLN